MTGRIRILALAPRDQLALELEAELSGMYELCLVRSGDDLLARLSDERAGFDVVLAPESSGDHDAIALAGRLTRASHAIPVIALATIPESRDLTAAINAQQLAAAVQVPWRRWELAAAVQRTYERERMRAEIEQIRRDSARRLEAMTATSELAAATSDVKSYGDLVRVLAQGLGRVVDVRISAAVLLPAGAAAPALHLHCHQTCDETMLRAARDRCLEALRTLSERDVPEDQVAVEVTGERLAAQGAGGPRWFFRHVPIHVDRAVVGLLLVDVDDTQLAGEDEKLLYYLAARAADARRRLSEQIEGERRRLSLMVESMADGIILTDSGSDLVLINPAARRMLGIEPERLVTTRFLKDRLGFYPFDLVAARPTAASDETPPLREEVRVGEALLHSIVSPVRDGAGKLIGVVVVLRDMTEARALARRQAEFVSVVSHELRTPLTSIAGALDIVLSGYAGRMGDKAERYLKMARDACNRLNMIVDDLLDIARTDDGRMPVKFTPLALDQLGQEVVERYRSSARSKNVDLTVTSEDRDIRIVGDADRLTQVLTNLLSNAIKFTPPEGRIDVEIFGPSVASDHVGVSVFNDGEPIPEDARERIFEKFEQLEDSSTRKVGGTGLGLAISRAIIEAHGGRIWVESTGDGTKFVFTLPAAPDEEETADEIVVAPDARRRPTAEQATVLLVDDDQYSSYILKGILMAAGHDVMSAEDVDSALTQARARRPALVVVNASLKSADGIALVEIFKHDPDTRKTAVLVVSGADHREAALGAGADEFLDKPLQPAMFRDTIARLIAEAGRVNAQRVLIVDDDPGIRLICGEVLANAGYSVREAEDGMVALVEAKRFRPDLLLLDVMMPRMDGFQTAERFRADPATSMTPIIFLSAKGETADKVRAFRSGAEDYVVKPFDAAELVARVSKALERHTRELGASPTTQLPGSNAIEKQIERRLAEGEGAFCYLDLDNLKAFNDYYGYAKADGVIRQTGDLIRDTVARQGSQGDFIGHIAGDDFVFITTSERTDAVCSTICATFDRLVPLYYNRVDRERGYIETKDRYGVLRKFPIMSVSIACVTIGGGHVRSYSELASAAAEGKKIAKAIPGSSYVRDGEPVVGTMPDENAGHEVA